MAIRPDPQTLVAALTQAHLSGEPLRACDWVSAIHSEAQAYAVQDGVAAALGWPEGPLVRHWKSGGATRSGPFSHAPLDPAGINSTRRTWPLLGVEAEVALRLGRDVSPEAARAMVPEAAGNWIDAMAVSVEVVASRWAEGLAAPLLLRLADHQSHAGLLLGPWQPYAARDWLTQTCEVQIGSQAPVMHTGSHSLNDPAWLLPAWLQHLTRHGATVAAGTVVTTGSWVGCLPVQPGDRVSVDFAGLGHLTAQV
jgi:2-keto-4-pentenoate hydratase/2-oxohepta-3-ene-1,7-dioic acid hydratase in catechol pathway